MSDLFETDQPIQSGPDTQSLEPIMPIGSAQVTIGRWAIDRYVRLTRWPVLATAAIVAALLYVGQPSSITWGVELILFVWLGWLVASRDGNRLESLTTGIIAGVGLGLMVSIIRLLLNRELTYVINVVAETMLTAIIGGLVTTSVTIIRKIFFRST